MAAQSTPPDEHFASVLKQWAHFPETFDKSIKEGVFINGEHVTLGSEEDKKDFFLKIISEIESAQRGNIDEKTVRKLFKINAKSNLGSADLITKLAFKSLGLEDAQIEEAHSFHYESLNNPDGWNKDKLIERLTTIDSSRHNSFAKSLALLSPALLFLTLPFLTISPSERHFLAKLAVSNSLTKGLDSLEIKQKKQLLSSISMDDWISNFRVQTDSTDNIRGLLNYLAEQLLAIPEFNPPDLIKFSATCIAEPDPSQLKLIAASNLQFLHLVNGIFKHGILCRTRAQRLGIAQVYSQDLFTVNPDSIKVNYIHDREGLKESKEKKVKRRTKSLSNAIFDAAKGAFTIALERPKDPLLSKITFFSKMMRPGRYLNIPEFKDPKSLEELSLRTHYCLLAVSKVDDLQYHDNDGIPSENNAISQIHSYSSQSNPSYVGCHEVAIDANLAPSSISTLLLPAQFETFEKLLFIPSTSKVKFVKTIEAEIFYALPTGFSSMIRGCIQIIPAPDFLGALKELFPEGKLITLVCKGNTYSDLTISNPLYVSKSELSKPDQSSLIDEIGISDQ